MPRTTICSLVMAAAPVWAQTAAGLPAPPPAPSLSSAFAHLERAETQLRRLALAGGTTNEPALEEYAKAISRYHLELGGLRADRNAREFIAGSLARLRRQALGLEQLAEKAQSDERAALNEPLSHIRAAIELSELKLNRRRRWLRFRFGEPSPAGYRLAPWDGYVGRPPR